MEEDLTYAYDPIAAQESLSPIKMCYYPRSNNPSGAPRSPASHTRDIREGRQGM